MVMVANNGSQPVKDMAARHPGKIGWLMGPSGWKRPLPGVAYALDNDAFSAWMTHTEWDEDAWLQMLDRSTVQAAKPIWVLVPDVVADRLGTIRNWKRYASVVDSYGYQKAFAVQDGMTPEDVPASADVVFVGGTTRWKWRSVTMWAEHFPRVHVGRVRQTKLLVCDRLGVESCDGTGWFREGKTGAPARFLKAYIEGHIKEHPDMFLTAPSKPATAGTPSPGML